MTQKKKKKILIVENRQAQQVRRDLKEKGKPTQAELKAKKPQQIFFRKENQ